MSPSAPRVYDVEPFGCCLVCELTGAKNALEQPHCNGHHPSLAGNRVFIGRRPLYSLPRMSAAPTHSRMFPAAKLADSVDDFAVPGCFPENYALGPGCGQQTLGTWLGQHCADTQPMARPHPNGSWPHRGIARTEALLRAAWGLLSLALALL